MDIDAAEHRIKEWCVRGYDIRDEENAVKDHMKPRPRNLRASDLRPLETLEGLIRKWDTTQGERPCSNAGCVLGHADKLLWLWVGMPVITSSTCIEGQRREQLVKVGLKLLAFRGGVSSLHGMAHTTRPHPSWRRRFISIQIYSYFS